MKKIILTFICFTGAFCLFSSSSLEARPHARVQVGIRAERPCQERCVIRHVRPVQRIQPIYVPVAVPCLEPAPIYAIPVATPVVEEVHVVPNRRPTLFSGLFFSLIFG